MSVVSTGIREDSDSSDLSNWEDGTAIHQDRFEPTGLLREAKQSSAAKTGQSLAGEKLD